jgi:ABC-type branched-subunit amino acid transport system ATPase component/ABC-type branched-subunit amino acid transport system permease subunit
MKTQSLKWSVVAAGLGFLAAFPMLVASSYWLNLVNLSISFAIVSLGLNIILGYTGQLSLAQAAFWGIGAYTSALLTTSLGWSVWGGIAAAITVTALFGILLGFPAMRISGHNMAMVTIGYGVILQLILIDASDITKGSDGIAQIPSPWFGPFHLNTPAAFFYLAIASLLLAMTASARLKHSRFGRALMAIRENEMAAKTMGINAFYFKVMAFGLSAAYAGLAGALFAHSGSHYISPDTFSLEQSIMILAMMVMGGSGSALGSVVGAALLTLVPEVLRFLKEYYMLIYSAGIVAVIVFMPGGIMGLIQDLEPVRRQREWWRGPARAKGNVESLQPEAKPVAGASASTTSNDVLLSIQDLKMHFGGLKAVDGLDMQLRRGEIHALIGPNGSGKTTTLNVMSGLFVPTAGSIVFEGRDITGQPPHAITENGIARTFQNIRLFGQLSVIDNVLIGQHSRSKSGLLAGIFHLPGQQSEEARLVGRARGFLDFVALNGVEGEKASSLPYGQQRLLELARALASAPTLLLLDEPAAGLNDVETDKLLNLLLRIRGQGISILLVEHDMQLVMAISDTITVLNFGRKIAEGSAEAIESDPQVVDAYLGAEVQYA